MSSQPARVNYLREGDLAVSLAALPPHAVVLLHREAAELLHLLVRLHVLDFRPPSDSSPEAAHRGGDGRNQQKK